MADNANPINSNAGVEILGQLNNQWVASGGAAAVTAAVATPCIVGSSFAACGLVWDDAARMAVPANRIGRW